MKLDRNVGNTDSLIRIVVGLALIALALTGTIGWWGYVGIVPLATAFLKFCPAYSIIGLKTCQDC